MMSIIQIPLLADKKESAVFWLVASGRKFPLPLTHENTRRTLFSGHPYGPLRRSHQAPARGKARCAGDHRPYKWIDPEFESSRMLVREDGSIAGTIGGGCVEADVWAAAKEVMNAEVLAR